MDPRKRLDPEPGRLGPGFDPSHPRAECSTGVVRCPNPTSPTLEILPLGHLKTENLVSILIALIAEVIVLVVLVAHLARRPNPALALATGALAIAIAATPSLPASQAHRLDAESEAALKEALPVQGAETDFASSDSCQSCHPDEYASWKSTFHRTMTQAASPETIRAPFDGVTLSSRGRTYALERRGDEFWVDMVDPDWERVAEAKGEVVDRVANPPRVERRVVMVTGSHHMQTYWVGSVFGNELNNLPFVYLFEASRWIPREEVFLRPPELGRFTDLWNSNCIECHATKGVPGLTEESDAFATRAQELGIACEACHGPGKEHLEANQNPLRRYGLHYSEDGDPTIVEPSRLSPRAASQVCGQCHGVALSDARDWLAQGHDYRPGEELGESRFLLLPARNGDHPRVQKLLEQEPRSVDSRFWGDGRVRVSGREYSGLVESACALRGELGCLSCHSMHDSSPNDQLAAGMAGDQACLNCHQELSGERLTDHTRHLEGSSGSRCYNCHMPYTTYGLLGAIRSHTVASPSARETTDLGRPNACNSCHLDRSLGWTAQHLAEWYGQKSPPLDREQEIVSSALLQLLRGDAGQRALAAWHLGWPEALATSGDRWVGPFLSHLLADPYSAVRYIAARSLSRAPGYEDFEVDFLDPPKTRHEDRMAGIRTWIHQPWGEESPWGESILIYPDGNLDLAELTRLAAQRDDRPVFLGE